MGLVRKGDEEEGGSEEKGDARGEDVPCLSSSHHRLSVVRVVNLAPLWVVNLAPPLGAYFFLRRRRAMRVALHGDGEEEEEEGEGREGGR